MLAFACAFTMFAGAAYSDQADIQHTDAVNMLSSLGVLDGYEDGSFRPEATITRAEMAKMIYTIRNGGNDNADAYKSLSTSFTDINGTWAEGYIKYCQVNGIIDGKSTTSFDPNGDVTVVETAKMALVLMGYKADADRANLVGTGWDQRTLALAGDNGLMENVSGGVASPIIRDEAAQLLYNTVDADCVLWSNDKETFVKDTYTVGTSEYTYSVGSKYLDLDTYEGVLKSVSNYDAMKGTDAAEDKVVVNVQYINGNVQSDGAADFALKYKEDATALIGEYVKVLYDNDEKLAYGVYSVAEENYVVETTMGKIDKVNIGVDEIKVDGTTYDLDFTVAGTDTNVYNTPGSTGDDFATVFNGNKSAAKVKLISNDGDEKIDIAIVVPVALYQLTYVGSDNVTFKSVNSAASLGNKKTADCAISGDLAKDDYVAVVDKAYNLDGKYEVSKIDVMEGKATEIKVDSSSNVTDVKVDGTWYTLLTGLLDTDNNKIAVDNTYKFVMIDGYVYNAEMVTGSATKIALVTGKTSNEDFDGYVQTRIMLTDGTEVTAYMGEAEASTDRMDNIDAGELVAYEQDGDRYTLYLVGKSYSDSKNTAKALAGYTATTNLTSGTIGGALGYDESAKMIDGKKINDNAVVFMQYDSKPATAASDIAYKVITGKDVNSWKSDWGVKGAGLYKTTGLGYLDIAVIVGDDQEATPNAQTTYAYVTSDVAEGSDYVTYSIWDGTSESSVTVQEKVSATSTDAAKGKVISFDWDGEGVIKNVQEVTAMGAITYAGGSTQVGIDGVGYDLADDVTILNVNTEDKVGVSGNAISEAQKDADGTYYANVVYVYDTVDEEIDLLVIDVQNNKWDGSTATYVTPESIAKQFSDGASKVTVPNKLASGTVTVPSSKTLELKQMPAAGVVLKVASDATDVVFENEKTLSSFVENISGELTLTANGNGGWTITAAEGTQITVKNETSIGKETNNFYVAASENAVADPVVGTVPNKTFTYTLGMGADSNINGWFATT